MMSNIYISPYRDGTGYGNAAIGYILAMDYAGIPVKPKFIRHTPNLTFQLHPKVLELEKVKLDTVDNVLQHTLPIYYTKTNFQDIGIFALESNKISYEWLRNLEMMDKIVVFSKWQQSVLAQHGLDSVVIPHAIDMNIYYQNYHTFRELQQFRSQYDFIFYTIGSNTKRKHLVALLQAFLIEFSRYDNVGLVIKTDNNLFHNTDMNWPKFVEHVRDSLGVNSQLDNIAVFSNFLSDTQIYELHNTCDCYVNTSYGEAFCIPAIEALGFGKTPIVPNSTCFPDYINNDNGYLVNSYSTPSYENDNPHQCGDWFDIDISHLRKVMRESITTSASKKERGMKDIMQFSFKNVGAQMRDLLCPESKNGKIMNQTNQKTGK